MNGRRAHSITRESDEMKSTILILATLATLAAGPLVTTGHARHDGAYLRDLTMDFQTASLPWCLNPAGGKPRVLFVIPRQGGRDVVELAQRLGLDFEAFAMFHSSLLAFPPGEPWEASVEGTSPAEKTQELLAKLDKDYDLIVLGNASLDVLPPEAQFKILAKVSAGAGLLQVYPINTQLKALFATKSDGVAEILALAPLAGLPERARKVPPADLLKTYRFGKGRIAAIDYRANHGTYYSGQSLACVNTYSPRWDFELENTMALLIRAALWAAGRESAPSVSCAALASAPTFERGARSLEFAVDAGFPAGGALEVRVRDADNRVVKSGTLAVAARPSTLPFELPVLPAGDYSLDLVVREAAAGDTARIFDCGALSFGVASPVGKLVLGTADGAESYKENAPFEATLQVEKPLAAEATVVFELRDSPHGRVWFRQGVPLKAGETAARLAVKDYPLPTIAGLLTCRVDGADGEIARAWKYLFFPKRKLDDFILMCWGGVPEHHAPVYAARLVDRLGWRCGLNPPSPAAARLGAIFNQRQVSYIARVGLRGGKEHPDWTWGLSDWGMSAEEKKRLEQLQGDHSIYNPAAREWWRRIVARAADVAPFGPAFYNLGDENFFSYDSGFSPSEQRAFTEFLQSRYGTIARLNEEWGSDFADFGQVKHLTLAEAKQAGNFAAWFDHRRFMERQYADTHRFLAAEITALDPGAIVGAEGSEPGDLEESIRGLGFWGPYSDAIGDELLRSIGGDRIRTLWWGGYTGSHGGRDGYPLPLWKDVLRGNVNGSAWYTVGISSEGMQGLDLDFAAYMKRMLPHLDALNDGAAALLATTPLSPDGVAVLWSHPSASAALLDPRCVNPKDSMGAFTAFSYATGIGFDYLTESGLAALATGKYKVLMLFGATALSPRETKAIEAFVQAGGTVVADLNPGILGEFLRPLPAASLGSLFGERSFAALSAPEMLPLDAKGEFNGRPLRMAAGKALQNKGTAPLQVRQVGKGAVVVLGFTLGAAAGTAAKDTPLQAFLLDLLAAAGVSPRVRTSGLSGENGTLRVRRGDGWEIIGVQAGRADWGKEIRFAIPTEAFVYEVDRGLVGHVKEWTATLDPPFKLYAVFEQQPVPPAVRLAPPSVARGSAVALDMSAVPVGAVLRIRLLGPDRTPLPLRDQVMAVKAPGATASVAFAHTDAPGACTIAVRDVRTGLETLLPVEVR